MHIYRLTLFVTLAALTGCIPFPHTSERFSGMKGHVVDALTGQPISGAVVAVRDHPSTEAKTDTSGEFYISKRRNYHIGVTIGICGDDWPAGSHWSDWLDVSHLGYEPRHVDASKLDMHPYDYDNPYQLHDIALTPKKQ